MWGLSRRRVETCMRRGESVLVSSLTKVLDSQGSKLTACTPSEKRLRVPLASFRARWMACNSLYLEERWGSFLNRRIRVHRQEMVYYCCSSPLSPPVNTEGLQLWDFLKIVWRQPVTTEGGQRPIFPQENGCQFVLGIL